MNKRLLPLVLACVLLHQPAHATNFLFDLLHSTFCPNHDWIHTLFGHGGCENNKCNTGGPNESPAAPQPGGAAHTPTTAGDPVEVGSESDVLSEVDVNVPVKYGMSLNVTRSYTKKFIDVRNDSGDTLFGRKWTSPIEKRLVEGTDFATETTCFYYEDEHGQEVPFVEPIGFFPGTYNSSRLSYAPPHVLDIEDYVDGGNTYWRFRITMEDRSQVGFNRFGHATYEEQNIDTPVDERLTYVYDTDAPNQKLTEIHAPSGDDRYLQFIYGLSSPMDHRVTEVDLVTSSHTVALCYYQYDADGMLYEVKPSTGLLDYKKRYEYGRYNHSANSWTAQSYGELMRTSYFLTNPSTSSVTQRFLSASEGGSYVTDAYTYNINASTWDRIFTLDDNGNSNNRYVTFEGALDDGNGSEWRTGTIYTNTTMYALGYDFNVDKMNYSVDIPSPPTPVYPTVAPLKYRYAGHLSGSDWITDYQLQDEVYHVNPSNNATTLIEHRDYSTSASNHLDKFRLISDKKYQTSSVYVQTDYTYDSTYPSSSLSN